MKKFLFIDRDGTIIKEAPPTYQVDRFDKLEFYPGIFKWLSRIATELDFELVMVTNQDGLGSASFPEDEFWPIQNFIIKSLANEGIHFEEILIDRSFEHENKNSRKPGTGMLTNYLNEDLSNSYVIGDRESDVELARNLGCSSILLKGDLEFTRDDLRGTIALETSSWNEIYEFLRLGTRVVEHRRNTNETEIQLRLDLDGEGRSTIRTGLHFFDHMLEQLSRHSGVDLDITVKGDLHIDEHHTIEDTAIALGQAFSNALGNKTGINRYGYLLPMDDCLAQVAIDFGGRPWLVWDATFKREKIGDMPTEMFMHFFKSFSDTAKCNLNIKADGENEHHKIESIFKAFAKSIQMAIRKDVGSAGRLRIPTTKGVL